MLGGLFSAFSAEAQVPAPAEAPAAAPAYQFMHVRYRGNSLFFSPAYQGKEWMRVTDYLDQRFQIIDRKQLGWEAMSRLLNNLSAEQWELVSVLPDKEDGDTVGAIYLLRKPR